MPSSSNTPSSNDSKSQESNVPVAQKRPASTSGQSFRLILLVLMVLQNTSAVLVGRYTRASVSKDDSYVINHLIVVCETIKLFLSCLLEHYSTPGQLLNSVKKNIVDCPLDAMKMIVPSLLFLIQNNLLYVALSNLSSPVFQVTYQAKLLTTAIFSAIMLHRQYSLKQWLCLLILGIGVATVILGESSDAGMDSNASVTKGKIADTAARKDESSAKLFLGLISVFIACLSSAFAGVYFEMVLKKPATDSKTAHAPVSLWMRNIQMAFFSLCIGVIQYMGLNGDDAAKSFMHGFTFWVYVLVGLQAGGGLLIAAVIKYADNVLKGMATGVSVCFGSVCSKIFFDTALNNQFFIGASFVLGSVYLFSNEIPCKSMKVIKNNKIDEMKPFVLSTKD